MTELGSSGRLRELGEGGGGPTHEAQLSDLRFLGAACHGLTITRAGSGVNPWGAPFLDVGEAVLQAKVELVARPTFLVVSRSARGTAVAPAKALVQQ